MIYYIMAGKQVVPKSFRVSIEANEIILEVQKRDFRDFPTFMKLALLEYVKGKHPDLYEALAQEFTPQ